MDKKYRLDLAKRWKALDRVKRGMIIGGSSLGVVGVVVGTAVGVSVGGKGQSSQPGPGLSPLEQFKKDYPDALDSTDPSNVMIRPGAFRGMTLPDDFRLPEGISGIGDSAFDGASVPAGFTIPASVSFGPDAFRGIRLPEGGRLTKDNNLVDAIGDTGHEYRVVNHALEVFKIQYPGSVDENNVIVGTNFQDKTLPDGFTIPEGIVGIERGVFVSCQLPTSFRLPKSIVSIGDSALFAATLPEGFTLNEGLVSIGDSAFSNVTLPESFTLPSTLTSIGESVFHSSKLPKNFIIPQNVKAIPRIVFCLTQLSDGFTIPSTVTSIDRHAFTTSDGIGPATIPSDCHWTKDGQPFTGLPSEGGHEYRIVKN